MKVIKCLTISMLVMMTLVLFGCGKEEQKPVEMPEIEIEQEERVATEDENVEEDNEVVELSTVFPY